MKQFILLSPHFSIWSGRNLSVSYYETTHDRVLSPVQRFFMSEKIRKLIRHIIILQRLCSLVLEIFAFDHGPSMGFMDMHAVKPIFYSTAYKDFRQIISIFVEQFKQYSVWRLTPSLLRNCEFQKNQGSVSCTLLQSLKEFSHFFSHTQH